MTDNATTSVTDSDKDTVMKKIKIDNANSISSAKTYQLIEQSDKLC